MSIKIRERLYPFSHLPGILCLIPRSCLIVQVFPTLLRFSNGIEIPLELGGPIQGFTVEQDLEKGRITVYGRAFQGYFRYWIEQEEKAVALRFDKFPFLKEDHLIPHLMEEIPPSKERLSLGMHKAQNWELIRRRSDLKEIFPIWLRLGKLLPELPEIACDVGTLQLLKICKEKVAAKEKEAIAQSFLNLFLAGFSDMLVPRLEDTQFQGLVPEGKAATSESSPLLLLKQGATCIRSLFFQEEKDQLFLLPCLPKEFNCGRYLGLTTLSGDELDLEWSKKTLRRLILRPAHSRSIKLVLQKELKSFRVRTSLQDRGQRQNADEPLRVVAGTQLLLDCFQK
jgi:hypothetical protein